MKDSLNDTVSITELLGVIVKRMKLLIFVFGIVMLVFLLYIGINKHPYKARITIIVDSIQNLTAWDSQISKPRSIVTEFQILTNQDTVRSTLQVIDLSKYSRKDGSDYQDLLVDSEKIQELQKAIKISPGSDDNSSTITFEHMNAEFAQDFLQSLIPIFESSVIEYVTKYLMQDIELLSIHKENAEENIRKIELQLKEILQIEEDNKNLDSEKVIASIPNQYLQGDTDNTFSFGQILNIDLLQKLEVIKKESALVADYQIQLLNLESFMDSLRNVVTIVDGPSLVNSKGESNDLLILAIGIVFATLIALIATLLAELFSDAIDNEQVLEKALKNESKIISVISKENKNSFSSTDILKFPDSPNSKAYNHLASFLLYSDKRKVYTVTSLGYRENTERIIMSVALSLVNIGKSVLILSTRPRKTQYQDFYTTLKSFEEVAISTQIKPLDLNQHLMALDQCTATLNIHTIDINARDLSRLLHSQQFADYINDSSKNYDLVIIDGPTFQTSWDLFAVAKISEGIVLSIQKSGGSRKQLQGFIRALKLYKIPLLGVVFNNIESELSRKELKKE